MKVQKGIVSYNDRKDIVCLFGVTDDGKNYYFLDATDEKKFSNGNRIASTELVEAIDPMYNRACHIGVVSEDDKEIIPFVNKSIRPINNDIILVEIAEPVSQSVIDSNELKNDPAAATKLVSTPATIKAKFTEKVGPDCRYIFNDQFSEATVYDINGNNLINNEYYSFIVNSNDKLYFSKNTVDSEIAEYSILPPEVQSDITPATDTNEIDVSEVEVDKTVVEEALNAESGVSEEVVEQPPVVEEAPEKEVVNEEVTEEVAEVNDEEVQLNIANEESPVAEESEETVVDQENVEVVDEEIVATEDFEPTAEEVVASQESAVDLDIDDYVEENVAEEVYDEATDAFDDYQFEADKIEVTDEDIEYEEDSSIHDVADSVAKLIDINKVLKERCETAEQEQEKLVHEVARLTDLNEQMSQKFKLVVVQNEKLKEQQKDLKKIADILSQPDTLALFSQEDYSNEEETAYRKAA